MVADALEKANRRFGGYFGIDSNPDNPESVPFWSIQFPDIEYPRIELYWEWKEEQRIDCPHIHPSRAWMDWVRWVFIETVGKELGATMGDEGIGEDETWEPNPDKYPTFMDYAKGMFFPGGMGFIERHTLFRGWLRIHLEGFPEVLKHMKGTL